MWKLLLLTIGLFINIVNCHNFAMVCADNKLATELCNTRYGYHCNYAGRIDYTTYQQWCSSVCVCISLVPRPRYSAQAGGDTESRLRYVGSVDRSTLSAGSIGNKAVVTIDERKVGRSTNCTDPQCCIERFARTRNYVQPTTKGDELKSERDRHVQSPSSKTALSQTFTSIRRGGGGGSAGAAAGALGAAGLGMMESTAPRTAILQDSVWMYLKVCVSMVLSGMIAAWVYWIAGGLLNYQRRVVASLDNLHVVRPRDCPGENE